MLHKPDLESVRKKTEVLRINRKCNNRSQIDNQNFTEVGKYTYLGATVNKQRGGKEDIRNRICKARKVFMKLKKIWASNIYSLHIKIRLFNALVKSVRHGRLMKWTIENGHFHAEML